MSTEILPPLKEFSIRESAVCQALGLNRDEVRALRVQHLQKGTDWILVKNRVAYSPKAVDVMRAALRLPPLENHEKTALCTNAEGMEAIPEKLTELLLLRVRNQNHRILVGHKSDEAPTQANWVYIRVRDASKYRRGMKLFCRHLNGTLFEHIGRIPRGAIQ